MMRHQQVKYFSRLSPRVLDAVMLALLILALVTLMLGPIQADAQATPGGTSTSGDASTTASGQQDTFTPPPVAVDYPDVTAVDMSQDRPLGSLSTLNESALTVYTSARHHPAFGVSAQLSGGYADNIYDLPSNKIGGAFSRFAFPVTYERTGDRSQFHASYFPEVLYYPEFTPAIYQSHSYGHDFLYQKSERTTFDWQLAAGHYRELGQYLPGVLAAGGIGIVQPTLSGAYADNSTTVNNVATTLAVSNKLSQRDSMTYTGTVAWSEDYQNGVPPGQLRQMLRSETGSLDALYQHAISGQTAVGLDASVIYIRGLEPVGHVGYATLLATARRQFTPSTSLSVGIGPLFSHSSVSYVSPGFNLPSNAGSQASNSPTYAGNVNFEHRSHFATYSAGYARVIQLNYLQAAVTANDFSATVVRPISPLLDLTVAAVYIKSDSSSVQLQQSTLGGSGRLDYHLGSRMLLFVNATTFRLSVPSASTYQLPYNRNEFSGGITISLNAIAGRQGR